MIDAVIFDWGGTLTPWRRIEHADPWHAYAAAVHPDDPQRAADIAAALLAADTARWGRVVTEHAAFHTRHVLQDAGVEWHEAGVRAYRDFWEPHTITDPEVGPLFAGLRLRGLKVGVLSSTPWPGEWHDEILERDGVLAHVHGAVWSSDLEWTKPHPEAFRAAMSAVGVDDPTRCVYVGDRPYDDMWGASTLGMKTIFVPHSDIPAAERPPVDVTPDAVVRSIGDVLAIVDGWLAHAAGATGAAAVREQATGGRREHAAASGHDHAAAVERTVTEPADHAVTARPEHAAAAERPVTEHVDHAVAARPEHAVAARPEHAVAARPEHAATAADSAGATPGKPS